jgi:hypothetical protein
MKKLYSIPKGTCLKFIILTGLLLSGISIKAQSNGGDTKTYAKGDINEDGYVNATDVVALVEIIMNGNGKEDSGDENPVYYPDVVKNQYKTLFVQKFGMPSPNQRWGFNFNVTGSTSATSFRVIAEDLVSNDFDFNDVVFDVEENDGKMKVTVQAIGTTVAMRIFGHEVHDLFGVAKDVMVNVGPKSYKLSPVSFEVEADFGEVFVQTNVRKDLLVQLWALAGDPTAMIAVNTNYEWCNEEQSISNKYSDFCSWVQGSAQEFYSSAQSTQSVVYIDEDRKNKILAGMASTLCDFKSISNNVEKWYTGIENNSDFVAPVSPSSQILYNYWASPYTLTSRSLTMQAFAEESNQNSLLTLCDIIDALAYVELTTYFGDIPYRTKDDDPFSGIPKQSTTVIITNLITRLSQTLTYADERKGGQISGTTGLDYFANPTSDLASLILAELHISNGNYQSALPLLAGIISSGRYSIEGKQTRSGLNSNEIIFSLINNDAVETIFRTYTDVLLLKAECDYMTGNSSSAKQLTDYIISNKGIDVSETNIAKAIAAIRRKLYEQTNGYFHYLKRSGLAKEILGLEDYQLLLPIPSNEILFNPYVTQNPGY